MLMIVKAVSFFQYFRPSYRAGPALRRQNRG